MDFLYFDQINKQPILIPVLIGTSTVVVAAINIYGLTNGITNILPHLLYIPIILGAYYYSRWGVSFTLVLSALYCGAVFVLYPATLEVQTAALAQGFVYVVTAGAISFLSGRMHPDTRMCRRLVSIFASSCDAIVAETFESVRKIRFSFEGMPDTAVITYRDDGVGISLADKDKLFRRGFGKHTGLGLFLTREILSITGIMIIENGEPGNGVHFELRVPKGSYPFPSSQPAK
ncbi:MAG: ATP-binding protein [Methanoregula sp.]|nr:ATP-binding protein [Methanoregula sp.]